MKSGHMQFLKNPIQKEAFNNAVVGGIMSFIGIVFTMRFFDKFGLAWTIVAVLYTGTYVGKLVSLKMDSEGGGIEGEVGLIDETNPNLNQKPVRKEDAKPGVEVKDYVKNPETSDVQARLNELKKLYDEKTITKEEYEDLRKRIIGKI